MKRFLSIFLRCLFLPLLMPLFATAGEFTTQITVTNGTLSKIITLGVNSAATYGIDPALGEIQQPPPPPSGVFDTRSVNIPDRPTSAPQGLGQGVLTDIRKFISDSQLDTFKLQFQSSSDQGTQITLNWDAGISSLGGGQWRLMFQIGDIVLVDVDMTQQSSFSFNSSIYNSLYIFKSGDTTKFRTFSLETVALDGVVASSGKKTYGKLVPVKSNQVEFCAAFTNTEGVSVNDLHVEFKVPIDPVSLSVTDFIISQPSIAGKHNKWDFSGATIDDGQIVTICGFGVKSGTKEQIIGSWYWTNNGEKVGVTKKIGSFTKNIVRLPMPNSLNALDETMRQSFPGDDDYLIIGESERIDKIKIVKHKKYKDVLKTLVKDAAKPATRQLQDVQADCLSKFDSKSGFRAGGEIKSAQKGLPPNKHRNRLLGQALVLAANIKMSETQKTPPGLGQLEINLPLTPFHGQILDTLLSYANQYLTWCSVDDNPAITADELADMLKQVNEAFEGPIDTISWSGSKIKLTGSKEITQVSFLKRNRELQPKIIPDFDYLPTEQPAQFKLEQNFPNPFNPTTTIQFELAMESFVTLKVYNMLGQEVATLADRELISGGLQEVEFDAKGLASGLYFYRLVAETVDDEEGSIPQQNFVTVKKMLLMK